MVESGASLRLRRHHCADAPYSHQLRDSAEPIGVIYSRWAGFSWPDRSRRAISQAADSTHAPDPPKARQNAYGESASSR